MDTIYPKNTTEWRQWLEEYHLTKTSVWVVFYTKSSKKESMTWSEAVDVALCFGWIDSKKIKIDDEKSHQYFSKRKPKGTWSKINKKKVENLIENNLMAPAGFQAIETAKKNGSWNILDVVDEMAIPQDLEVAFQKYPGAKDFFLGLSNSIKKMMLYWVISAKRTETRQKRILEIVESTGIKTIPGKFL